MAYGHALKYREAQGEFWLISNGVEVVPVINFSSFCKIHNLSRSHLYWTATHPTWKCKGWRATKTSFESFYKGLKQNLYQVCQNAVKKMSDIEWSHILGILGRFTCTKKVSPQKTQKVVDMGVSYKENEIKQALRAAFRECQSERLYRSMAERTLGHFGIVPGETPTDANAIEFDRWYAIIFSPKNELMPEFR